MLPTASPSRTRRTGRRRRSAAATVRPLRPTPSRACRRAGRTSTGTQRLLPVGRHLRHRTPAPTGSARRSTPTTSRWRATRPTTAAGLASSSVPVPGYSRFAGHRDGERGAAITLAAQRFGSPGARRFKIETPPTHGTLSVAASTAFVGPQVTYTPESGYTGPDSFSYFAYDSASAYPAHPPTAMVDVTVQP